MTFKASLWTRLSLLNLLFVAALGVLMRYKIGFDFPYLSQKNIQHAHSHFAFLGWVTHSIYILMTAFVASKLSDFNYKRSRLFLILNLVLAYGMLISFFVTGYSFVSIALATLSITNNCFIAHRFFKDFNKITGHTPEIIWFKSALIFNLASSLGTFYLAYMMASKNFNEHLYLAAVYFYLHFQYNGFFIFSCIGFLINRLPLLIPGFTYNKNIFRLFISSCIPAYFLSTLWANLPLWLYFLVVIAAFGQVVAWFLLLKSCWKGLQQSTAISSFAKKLLVFVSIAFTIKLLLQLGSTIPELSKLAFGFRPVVIAYLHLVLLAVISAFIIAYFYITRIIPNSDKMKKAIVLFFTGILLNEVVLAIQGVASFGYVPVKYINEILFAVSLVLLSGAIWMVISNRESEVETAN